MNADPLLIDVLQPRRQPARSVVRQAGKAVVVKLEGVTLTLLRASEDLPCLPPLLRHRRLRVVVRGPVARQAVDEVFGKRVGLAESRGEFRGVVFLQIHRGVVSAQYRECDL